MITLLYVLKSSHIQLARGKPDIARFWNSFFEVNSVLKAEFHGSAHVHQLEASTQHRRDMAGKSYN